MERTVRTQYYRSGGILRGKYAQHHSYRHDQRGTIDTVIHNCWLIINPYHIRSASVCQRLYDPPSSSLDDVRIIRHANLNSSRLSTRDHIIRGPGGTSLYS